MIEVRVYDLPTLNIESNIHSVEEKFCELNSRYRNGEKLDEVEISWFDCANTWLSLI